MRAANPVFMLDAADLAMLKMGHPLDLRITFQLERGLEIDPPAIERPRLASLSEMKARDRRELREASQARKSLRRKPARKPKPAPKPLRTQYTNATKAALVAEARANGVPRTAKAHGVREGLLYTWVRNAKKAPAEVSDIQTASNTQP